MNRQTSAIVVSAGSGQRMNLPVPKQFLMLREYPVLYYTLKNINAIEEVHEIIIATLPSHVEYCRELALKHNLTKVKSVVNGGSSRQESVYNALLEVNNESDLVLVHDGVRPFTKPSVFKDAINQANDCATVAGVLVTDTIKKTDDNNFVDETIDRSRLWGVQTPQVIPYVIFKKAHETARKRAYTATDDVGLVEQLGYPVKIIESSYDNIKITTPRDLYLAEQILCEWT